MAGLPEAGAGLPEAGACLPEAGAGAATDGLRAAAARRGGEGARRGIRFFVACAFVIAGVGPGGRERLVEAVRAAGTLNEKGVVPDRAGFTVPHALTAFLSR